MPSLPHGVPRYQGADDEGPHADARGTTGAPPHGRRADDPDLHALLATVQEIAARQLPKPSAWSLKQVAGTVAAVAAFATSISVVTAKVTSGVSWFGGSAGQSPGEKLDSLAERIEHRDQADSAWRAQLTRWMVHSSVRMSANTKIGCLALKKAPADACEDAYQKDMNDLLRGAQVPDLLTRGAP